MASYLAAIEAAPAARRWPIARRFLFDEPMPFFAELRRDRPVLVLPEVTLATRFADCAMVLRRHQDFGVDLYRPKQGDYWMAQDDTSAHWREKSVMRAILDFEQLPAMRAFVGETARAALARAGGKVEAVGALTRAVPVALVQKFFGFADSDPHKLIEWSYWNQQDAFWNQPFDTHWRTDAAEVVDKRRRAGFMMALYLARLVARRTAEIKLGLGGDDPVSRLLRLTFSDATRFNLKKVVFNAGGLLIGAVETTSHAVVNALSWLLANPAALASARAAATTADRERFDGHVWEALRFRPAFPYFFRVAHRATELAGGTPGATVVPPGTTVLAVTHSAMFDAAAFPDPERFDPARSHADMFTLGHGLHECLGRAIASVMLPEIVRQALLLPGLVAEAPPVLRGGVPDRWMLRWG